MEGPVPESAFWAKLRPYHGDEVDAWHPLADHCADVAACLERLLERPIIRKRLASLGGLDDLSPVQTARLCVLAGLHDLGKYNIGFQNRRFPNPPFTAGHVKEALAVFRTHGRRLTRVLGLEAIQDWTETVATLDDLLIATFAHHGRPERPGALGTPGAWEASGELDPFAGIAELRRELEDWYPEAFTGRAAPLPAATRFQHAYNGLLTLADWLGSNESFFPFTEPGDDRRIDRARERAFVALREIRLNASAARSATETVEMRARELWSFIDEPRPAQQCMEELAVETGPDGAGSLAILEAPTGSGKTEASLIRFLRLFRAGEVDGLYFALPTRSAATQMWKRVRDTMESVVPDPASRPPVTLAVPGYLDDESERQTLLDDFGSLWPEDHRRWRHLAWASERPKRYLAGSVVVGTVDQALLSALAVDHSHLRAASLLRHFLVVDEVHASDAYMSRILEGVLGRHLDAGGHALLMSATLGEAARSRFLRLTARPEEDQPERPVASARTVSYPVVMLARRGTALDVMPLASSGVGEKHVEIERASSMSDPDQVARRAVEAACGGALVLVIRNTVRGCRQVQASVERVIAEAEHARLFTCDGRAAPHHSRFAAPDRKRLDAAVEAVFGRERPDGGRVLVATQTVEQSLDIDADLLITDLCPADVLLQRIGRLHRHDRGARPPGSRDARVVVLVPESRDLGTHIQEGGPRAGRASGPHGLGTIYEDLRVIEATWRELRKRERLELPGDARDLVEAATHPDSLQAVVEENGGAWAEHGRAMDGVLRAEKAVAELNLADWSTPFGASLFPDRLDARIRTRLGEGDRRAVFPRSVTGPFGSTIEEIRIPAWMAPRDAAEDTVAIVDEDDSALQFEFGSETYLYDRWGLRRARDSKTGGDA